jgi:ribosomal protein S18 acetylase RimI-like enzyme
VIRPARPEDAEVIASVHVATWRAAYAHAVPSEVLAAVDVGEQTEIWKRRLAGPGITFVCELEGEACGFVSVGASQDHPGEGELFAIYVRPDAWGTGVGTSLIERGEDELRARGFTSATLNVLADNPRARRFYERQGWVRGETFQGSFLGHEVELARHVKELSETAGV